MANTMDEERKKRIAQQAVRKALEKRANTSNNASVYDIEDRDERIAAMTMDRAQSAQRAREQRMAAPDPALIEEQEQRAREDAMKKLLERSAAGFKSSINHRPTLADIVNDTARQANQAALGAVRSTRLQKPMASLFNKTTPAVRETAPVAQGTSPVTQVTAPAEPAKVTNPSKASTKAGNPGAYGISPSEYVQALNDITSYNTMSQPAYDAETQSFLDKYFGGKVPTEEEFRSTYRSLIDAGKLTDADISEFHAGAGLVRGATEADAEYQEGLAEAQARRDAAIMLLGEDAPEYATGNVADYYMRYLGADGAYDAAAAYEQEAKKQNRNSNFFSMNPSGNKSDNVLQMVLNSAWYKNAPEDLTSGDVVAIQNMTDDQRATYMYIASQYGLDVAADYFKELAASYNKQAYETRDEALRKQADENPLLATFNSMVAAPTQIGSSVYVVGQKIKGEEIDPYHSLFAGNQFTQTPRDQVAQNITNKHGEIDEQTGETKATFKSWLMNAGYSALTSSSDSAWSALLSFGAPGVGSAMQGAWSLGGTAQDAILRGGNEDQALLLAGANALIEAATEYIPMDNLIKAADSNDIRTIRAILMNAVKGAASEAPGEALSELGTAFSDAVIMKELSNWSQAVKEKGVKGAAADLAFNTFTSGFVGAISGGASNVSASTGAYARNKIADLEQAALARADQQIAEERGEAPDASLVEEYEQDTPAQRVDERPAAQQPAPTPAESYYERRSRKDPDMMRRVQERAEAANRAAAGSSFQGGEEGQEFNPYNYTYSNPWAQPATNAQPAQNSTQPAQNTTNTQTERTQPAKSEPVDNSDRSNAKKITGASFMNDIQAVSPVRLRGGKELAVTDVYRDNGVLRIVGQNKKGNTTSSQITTMDIGDSRTARLLKSINNHGTALGYGDNSAVEINECIKNYDSERGTMDEYVSDFSRVYQYAMQGMTPEEIKADAMYKDHLNDKAFDAAYKLGTEKAPEVEFKSQDQQREEAAEAYRKNGQKPEGAIEFADDSLFNAGTVKMDNGKSGDLTPVALSTNENGERVVTAIDSKGKTHTAKLGSVQFKDEAAQTLFGKFWIDTFDIDNQRGNGGMADRLTDEALPAYIEGFDADRVSGAELDDKVAAYAKEFYRVYKAGERGQTLEQMADGDEKILDRIHKVLSQETIDKAYKAGQNTPEAQRQRRLQELNAPKTAQPAAKTEQPAAETKAEKPATTRTNPWAAKPAQETGSKSEARAEATKAEEKAQPASEKKPQNFRTQQTATVTDEYGDQHAVQVVGVESVEDDAVVLHVLDENGQDDYCLSSDLEFGNDMDELLDFAGARALDARGMRNYLEGYDSRIATPEQYAQAFTSVYQRAAAGLEYEDAVNQSYTAQEYLTGHAATSAFSAGMNAYNQSHDTVQAADVKNESGVHVVGEDVSLSAQEGQKRGKISKRYSQSAWSNLGKDGQKNAIAQMEMLMAMASRTKHTIVVEDSIVDKHGNHANAYYNPKTREIHVALDAIGGAYAYAAAHELGHAMKAEHSEAEWNEFAGYIKDTLSKNGQNWDDLVRYQMERFGYTLAEAEEEVVCNTIPAMLQDESNLLKLYKGNRTLFERIVDWVNGMLKDIKTAGDVLSKRSKSWSQMDALKNDRQRVQEMYDRFMAVMEKGAESRTEGDANVQGKKFSYAPDGKLANNGIERDMPDSKRAEVLRNMEIQTVPMAKISSEAQTLVERLKKGGMGRDDIGRAIKNLPEYKAIQGSDLHSKTITVPFQFSGKSVNETLKKMIVNGRFDFQQAVRFVELLGNLREQVENAVAVEVHTDRYLDRVYDSTKIENYGALLGIASKGNSEAPVLYELKNFKGNEKDKIHLVAVFEETKKGATQGKSVAEYTAGTVPTNVTTYIVSEFLPNINSSAGKLLKYFPNELMTAEQIRSAEIARLEQEKYTLSEKIGIGKKDLKTGNPVEQSQIDEIDRQIDEIRNGKLGQRDEQADTAIRFSMKETVEETRDMLAVHNLTEENMRNAMELGGLAMPSIAVIKAEQGHSQYGTISVIFDKSTIDPEASRDNEIYGGDAWTPTFPHVEYEADSNAEKRISDKYYELQSKVGNEKARVLYRYATDLEEELNRNGGVKGIVNKLKDNTDMMQLYLSDSGKDTVKPVTKKVVTSISAEQRDTNGWIISTLGEEEVRKLGEVPEGMKVGDHNRAWVKENAEAIRDIFAELMKEKTGDWELAKMLANNLKNIDMLNMGRRALEQLNGITEKTEEVVDSFATERAIRNAVDSIAYSKWLNDLFAGAEKRKGIRNGADPYTPSGNRRSFSATHWDVTLDNVVKAMRKEEKTGIGTLGRNIEGAAVKKYKSIKDVKADSGRLQKIDQDEYDAMRREFGYQFSEIASEYANGGDEYDAGDALVEYITKNATADGIYKQMAKNAAFYKPSRQVAEELAALVDEMKNAPTGYFEAKPRRAVGFDEMAAVIVPDNLSDDVRANLENAGVNVIEYEAGNDEDRKAKMNSEAVDKLKFSLRDTDENVQDALTAEQKAFEQVKGHRITAAEADKLAGAILKQANSDYDQQKLAAELSRIYDYIERGEDVDWAQVDDEKTALMARVMEKSKALNLEHEEMAKPIRDYFKRVRISLSDSQRSEAANLADGIGAYRRMLFGSVRLANSGTGLETAWSELSALNPELFPADANETDMPALLLQAVDAIKPVYDSGMGMNVEESATWLAGKMDEAYFGLPAVKAAAQSARTFGDSVVALKNAMKRFEESSWSEYQNALRSIKEAKSDQQKTQKQQELAALRKKYQQWREKDTAARKEREMKAKYRAKTERTVKTLTTWLNHPTDAKHVPAGVQDSVRRMLTSLDFSGKTTKTANELCDQLNILADALLNAQEGQGGQEEDNRTMFLERDQQMIDEIRRVSMLIKGNTDHQQREGRGIYDLTGMELKELSKWLDVVKHVVTKAGTMRGSNLPGTSVEEVAAASIMEIGKKKANKDKKWITKEWNKRFGVDMQDSFSFFERLGNTSNAVFMQLRQGFDKMAGLVAEAEKHTKTILENVDLKKISGKSAPKQKFQLESGEVELTKAQIMEMYVLSKREQAKGHLYGGGFRLQGDENVRPYTISKAELKAITDTLTDQEKYVADGLQKFLSKQCAAWGNRASMELLGYRKFGEEFYWPISTDPNQRNTTKLEDNFGANISAIKNQGMTKELTEGASNALVLGDIFDTYTRHISNMAAYSAYALPLSDFTRWYNSRGVKTEIEQALGNGGLKYINNFLMALNGSAQQADKSGVAGAAGWLTRNAKISSVGANMRVVVQQPTSYARAAMYMSPKYLSEALVMKKPDEKLVNKYCGIAQWKRWGFYETNVGPSLRQLIVGDASFANKTREAMMKPAAMGDEWTINHLWNACEAETRAVYPELERGSDEYYKQVGTRMSEIIDRTQVVDSVFHRSQMMRSKNAMDQMLTNFMAEPTKTYNMLMSAISDYGENRKNKAARNRLARAFKVYGVTGIMTAAAAAVVDAFRDDDDEKKWLEKYTDALKGNAVDNLNPLGMLPGVKDVLSLMQGYESNRLDLQSIQKIINLKDTIAKAFEETGKLNAYGVSYKVAQALSSLLGIPVSNVMRDFNAIYQTVSGYNPTLNAAGRKNTTVNKLYATMSGGKKADAQKLRAELKEKVGMSEKEIDTALAEKLMTDPKVIEAWTAKQEKRFADANRAHNALTARGFSADMVDKAILKYGDSVTPKEKKEKDPNEQLSVTLYSTEEVASAIRIMAGVERGGSVTEADVRTMISERVAGSSAADPEKSVISSVQSELKKDYLAMEKSGDTDGMRKLGTLMTNVLGTTQETMDKWVTEQHSANLKEAVSQNDSAAARQAVVVMRRDGKTDSQIKSSLSGFKDEYLAAVQAGDTETANAIRAMLMSLGLKGKNGNALYTAQTFVDWLR